VRPGAIIVIDNGSYQCRAGWAGQPAPRVVFRALLHRPRAKVRCSCVRRKPLPPCCALTRACACAHAAAQSLPDGASIVGDYDTSLLRGVDPTRCTVRTRALSSHTHAQHSRVACVVHTHARTALSLPARAAASHTAPATPAPAALAHKPVR
jgi:hypothetical protein